MTGPIHLNPTAPLASRVLLPGDPGRALLLAQKLLAEPKMFNHNRGLWGYTGTAADGLPLSIQSTGMGGPSAAIVIAELIALGARRFLRVGTCGAISAALPLGQLVIVTEALTADGTSRALCGAERTAPSEALLQALVATAEGRPRCAAVASTDLFYDAPEGQEEAWLAAGAEAVEMESATLFALAARRGVEAAAVLIVSDVILPSRRRIDLDALRAAERRAGDLAARALTMLGS